MVVELGYLGGGVVEDGVEVVVGLFWVVIVCVDRVCGCVGVCESDWGSCIWCGVGGWLLWWKDWEYCGYGVCEVCE